MFETFFCSERDCRHLYTSVTHLQFMQVCLTWPVPCVYFCNRCAGLLASIAGGQATYEGGTFLDRVWKPGQRFCYLSFTFQGGLSYTIRRAITDES